MTARADWVSGLAEPLPIRVKGPFGVYGAAEADGTRRVVLLADPNLPTAEASARLDAIACAHEALGGGMVPAFVRRGQWQGRHYVVLASDGRCDGCDVIQTLADVGERVPYAAAVGLLMAIAAELQRVHGTAAPSGRPHAVGSLSLASLLFSDEGRPWLLGFGDGFLAAAMGPYAPLAAPELALGEQPSPASDVFALAAFMRTMVPFVELPAAVSRVLRGASHAEDGAVADFVRSANASVWSLPPALRPSLGTLDTAFRAMLRILRVTPDALAHARFVAQVMTRESSAGADRLRVADDGSWFALGAGPPQRIASRAALRRIMLRLLAAHEARPGDALDVWTLLEAGWPGEQPDPESGSNRVYAAVYALRRLGLRDVIERFDAGYRVRPAVVVERAAAEGSDPGRRAG